VFHALRKSNFTRCTEALVIPQPGQVISKIDENRHGGKISNPKIICIPMPTAKYKTRMSTGISLI
jgi:hypothetical protein